MAKRKDWADLLGGKPDGTEPEGPKEPPVTVLMHTIVGNPDNPRPEEDYADDDPEFRELKASMKEIGQLQPLAVVSRQVYEKAKAEAVALAPVKTRKMLREADWVVVTGNRRLAAARQLGWTRIDIRVQDQLGDEEGRIDEAVIIENIHRKQLSKIAEAEYLKRMVERHGSQDEVARRIGKSQMYVSQRLALLKLAPDLQDAVDAGTLKVKDARTLAGQTADHDEQRARVAQIKGQADQAARPEPPVQNPVLNPPPSGAPEVPTLAVQNPVLEPVSDPAVAPSQPTHDAVVPEARTAPSANGAAPPRLPYDDGNFIAMHLITKMSDGELVRMLRVLNEHAASNGLEVQPAT